MAPPEKVRLGELLVRQQLISEEQLDAALKRQRASGRKLGRTLVDAGFVSEEQICGALARQMRIPYINLKQFAFNTALVQTLPEAQARRFRAIVLDESAGALRIGMADPTDLVAYDELTRLLKREINLAVVSESQLLATIDRVYRRTGEISALSLELSAELAQTDADFGAASGGDAALKDAPVVKLLQTVFEDAVQVRASDIHIEPQEKNLHVRFRIDGVLHLQTEADSKIASALVLRLKLMSGLDISEKRLPQDGRFHVDIRGSAGRRADLDHADPVRRIGRDAAAQPEHRPAQARSPRHAGADAGAVPGSARTRRAAWCSSPARPAAARRPRSTPRWPRLNDPGAQDHHGRGPGRVPPARHQPGAGAREDRARLRARPALGACARTRTSSWSAKCATRTPPRSACAPR